MRILFAVSSSENSKNDIVEVILNEYQKTYKEIISYKRALISSSNLFKTILSLPL